MTIPIPPYSALKDFWSWVSTRLRGRRLTPDVFRGWTVDQWFEPAAAIRKFGDQDILKLSDKADQEFVGLCEEVRSEDTTTTEEYRSARDVASERVRTLHASLRESLEHRLLSGELIARGFREPFSHGAPYLTISRNEWRIIKLDPSIGVLGRSGVPAAAGNTVIYVGLSIGKTGTKRLFRRG